jgi:S-(hydroxymethyl)mycothiol dehydrogenase
MRAAGLCHTDVSQVQDARFTPILLGHEGAGEVESVGPGVEDLRPGDPVLVCWKVPCGRCRRCLRDEPHLCEEVVGLAEPRVFRDGEPVGAMLNAGCFCELVVLPAAGAIPIGAASPPRRPRWSATRWSRGWARRSGLPGSRAATRSPSSARVGWG